MPIETDRLILRGWRQDDVQPLLAICQDPLVMRFLGPPQTLGQIEEAIAHQEVRRMGLGYCYWALWHKEKRELIGFCGLSDGPAGTPIEGAIDIGWRLRSDLWGKGYAREAAAASLDWGFVTLGLERVWSITVPANRRSWGLMERLGMRRHPDLEFDHPAVAEESPLKRHIVYGVERRR